MKICRIISAYSPYSFGGADIYAEKISRQIVKRGNPTVVITISPGGGESCVEEEGTRIYRFHPFNVSNVHRIGRKPLPYQGVWTLLDIYNPYSYHKIKRILEKESPDVVHLHTPLDVTLSACDAVKSLGLPLVYTIHDYLLLCRKVVLLHGDGEICTARNINPLCKIYRQFVRNVINKNVDLVISPSNFALELHVSNGFFAGAQKMVLPHGIDLSAAPLKTPSDMPFDGRNIDILYTGGLTRHKGVHILIDALKAIPRMNLRLHIVGGGVYEEELRRRASDDSRIIFHGKFPNKDMSMFYKAADMLVVPSIWYDVRPNVIPEAYREGLPVLGSNIGGIPEFVIHGKTGFIFLPNNTEDLKRVLIKAIDNPDLLKRFSENAKEFVKQFDMGLYLDKLIDIYDKAICINKLKKHVEK